jgi:hypothetical protein
MSAVSKVSDHVGWTILAEFRVGQIAVEWRVRIVASRLARTSVVVVILVRGANRVVFLVRKKIV